MRKIFLTIIVLSLFTALALALTACPRTTEIQPGQGTVETEAAMPPMDEAETALPEEGIAATPEELEAIEPVEDDAEAGDEEAVEPEGDEEGGDEEETEEAADEAATE